MTDQATQGATPQGQTHGRGAAHPKHYHHGKTPAAWAGTMIATVGFFVGGAGMVAGPNWVVFWIGAALLVIALIATVVLRQLGLGAD